jgi:hypothetical protein
MSEILDAVWMYSLYVKELSAIFLCVLLTLRLKKRKQAAVNILIAVVAVAFLCVLFSERYSGCDLVWKIINFFVAIPLIDSCAKLPYIQIYQKRILKRREGFG